MKDIAEFIEKTNFEELKLQKKVLIKIAGEMSDNSSGSAKDEYMIEKVDGLLNFLDAFQDMVVDRYGVNKFKVFDLIETAEADE